MEHIDVDHNRTHHDGTRTPGPLAEFGDSWGDGSPTWFTPEPAPNPRRRATRIVVATALGAAVIAIAATVQLASGPARPPQPSGLGFSLAPTLVVPTVDASPVASISAVSATSSGGLPASVTASAPTGPGPTQAATATTPPAATAGATLTVRATTVLNRGDSVQTTRTRLIMQANGDLAILDETGAMRWHTATNGSGDRAVFQNDGHLVVYDKANSPLWTSTTAGYPGAVLVLAANGNVTIVFKGTVVWSSNTAH